MFERLKGVIEETKADHVIIGTPSFSYKVFISLRTLQELPELGKEVSLLLHPIFKENDITLYGFTKSEDRDIFRELISVNKVGPKIGIALLSIYDRDEIVRLIAGGKSKELTRANGLGKRGADMIIAALRDKYKKLSVPEAEGAPLGAIERVRQEDQVFSDAVSALTGLGYSWEVASESVSRNYKEGMELEELIRIALINLNG